VATRWDDARDRRAVASAVKPSYVIGFNDERVPAGPENTARIALLIVVFGDAETAKRCARAGIYRDTHIPTDTSAPPSSRIYRPYKLIDPTTIETYMHPAGSPGSASAGDTGQYETFIANGRVLAVGQAYNEPHSEIVRDDLERLAAETAG
jgi:hypothetical protein